MLRRLVAFAFAIATSATLLWVGSTAEEADQGVPRFTFAEEVIIARNDALVALLPVDPRGVRRILDALAVAKEQPDKPKSAPMDFRGGPRPKKVVPPDATSNPDLNLLFQRSSPEAAYDLFQILKRVGQVTN